MNKHDPLPGRIYEDLMWQGWALDVGPMPADAMRTRCSPPMALYYQRYGRALRPKGWDRTKGKRFQSQVYAPGYDPYNSADSKVRYQHADGSYWFDEAGKVRPIGMDVTVVWRRG